MEPQIQFKYNFRDGSVAIITTWKENQKFSRINVLASRIENDECVDITTTFIRDDEDSPWRRLKNADVVV